MNKKMKDLDSGTVVLLMDQRIPNPKPSTSSRSYNLCQRLDHSHEPSVKQHSNQATERHCCEDYENEER